MTLTRPWRKYEGSNPTRMTRLRWRKRADELAMEVGCAGACHVCFRPVDGRRGSLKLMAPGSFRQRPFELMLCTACWSFVKQMLISQQTKLHRDHLAPEDLND